MSPERFPLLRTGSWGKAVPKMRTRAAALHAVRASPGRRALMWNACVVSLIPYLAQVVAPDRPLGTGLLAQFRMAMGTTACKWVLHFILAGLDLLFHAPGAPRCPAATARAIAALAAARGQA